MRGRRLFMQAAAGSLLAPLWPGLVLGQPSRSLSVVRRAPAELARASANLNAAGRHALVIGNTGYRSAPVLKNAGNDAKALGEQLTDAGFQVQVRLDLSRDAMLDAIEAHASRVAAARSVGLFFFAGHGVQLAWRNFLVPVDATIASVEDIPKRCVDLGVLMEGITRASNPMNVVVLDACRDNPFPGVRLEAKGLSQFDAPPGTLLAYATSPGNVASDGDGANGLYTSSLLQELKVPEAKIEDVFKRVRLTVRRRSEGQQVPWESTSLEEDFYFRPPSQFRPLSGGDSERQYQAELAAWEKVKAATAAAPLEEYLRRYPSGRFAELAQLRLDQVLAAQGEKRIRLQAAANPYSQGSAEADTAYRVGDAYVYRLVDAISRVEQSRLNRQVTRVTDQLVEYASGEVADLLGNPLRDYAEVRFDTPQQIMPVQYAVGKRWSTRNRISSFRGSGEMTQELVVAARERITVPAGTFNAFRIEARGSGSTEFFPTFDVERRVWMDPERVRQPIAQEDFRRTSGRVLRSDRLELLSYRQS